MAFWKRMSTAEEERLVLAQLEKLYAIGQEYSPEMEVKKLFAASLLAWVEAPHGYRLSLGPFGLLAVYPSRSLWRPCLHSKNEVIELCPPAPIAQAVGIAETYAMAKAPHNLITRRARWREDPASEKQKSFLLRMGVNPSPNLSKGDAEALITRHKPLPGELAIEE
jgi:hypothetical protein